jgi:ABC-type sugar transport system substrate-binding protein
VQIGLFLIESTARFQKQQERAGVRAAQAANVSIEVVFGEGDANRQRERAFEFIRRTPVPTAVVVAPVEDAGMRYVAQEALRRGCAWVTIQRDPAWTTALRSAQKVPCFAVAADQLGIGKLQGQQFQALLPSGGSVLYVTGPSTTQSAELRTAGMESSKGPRIAIAKVVGTWTEQSGYEAVKRWLESTRGLVTCDLIGGQNDDMAMGGRRAATEMAAALGRPELRDLRATGVDGAPEYGQRLVDQHELAATVVMPTTADKAIELLVPALRGESQPPAVTLVPVISYPRVNLLRSRPVIGT